MRPVCCAVGGIAMFCQKVRAFCPGLFELEKINVFGQLLPTFYKSFAANLHPESTLKMNQEWLSGTI